MTSWFQTKVLKLAAPVFVELALQIAIQVVDALMLSRIDDAAAGTVGILVTFFGLLMTVMVALAQSGTIRVAFALGAAKPSRTARLRWVMLLLTALVTVPLSTALYFGGASLLSTIYSLHGIQRQFAADYLAVAAWSVTALGFSVVLNSFLRSLGKPYWALPGAVLANGVNAALAYELVTRGYGVAGVAWAALTAQVLMIAWTGWVALVRLKMDMTAPRSLRSLRLHVHHLMTLFGPVVAEPVAYQSAQVAIGIIMARLGTEAMAARSYASSIYAFCLLWSISLAQAAQYLVSHELGRNNQAGAEAALWSCLRTAVLAGSSLALALALASHWLLPAFTSNGVVTHQAQLLLWIAFFVEGGRSSNIVVGAALKAAGDAAYPARIGLIFMIGMSVPLAALLGLWWGWGIFGIGIALGLDELIRGILNFRRWQQGAKTLTRSSKADF